MTNSQRELIVFMTWPAIFAAYVLGFCVLLVGCSESAEERWSRIAITELREQQKRIGRIEKRLGVEEPDGLHSLLVEKESP